MKKKQKEIIDELEILWKKNPRQRFGQLLFNFTRIGTLCESGLVQDPFYYLDNNILNDLKKANKNE